MEHGAWSIGLMVVSVGLFFSCHTGKHIGSQEKTVVHDTIVVVEKQIDTVFSHRQNDFENSAYLIRERLPDWFIESDLLKGIKIREDYQIDIRLNPFYFEEDFNGDGHLDIVIAVKEISTDKAGFAILHGASNNLFLIGAGTEIKFGLSDDMGAYDVWKVNREKKYSTGLDGNYKEEYILLSTPALEVTKTETGGGIIYWNGKEYAYLHRTC